MVTQIKSALLFSAILFLSLVSANAISSDKSLEPDIVLAHLKKSQNLIRQHLRSVKEAQLHFFWTTGYTFPKDSPYNPITEVPVGGANYGKKFFPYVGHLLEFAPNNLKIKFVCDDMTQASNQEAINNLKQRYGNRFEILPIDQVQKNLENAFPEHVKKIGLLFRNAREGNPVIASDAYRLLMPWAKKALDISETLITYVDVDTFCYGLEHQKYRRLLDALFEYESSQMFYCGRAKKTSDLIKLCIQNKSSYKEFCKKILKMIGSDKEVLSYFSNLHQRIKNYERKVQRNPNCEPTYPPFLSDYLTKVLDTTGPGFLYNFPKEITPNLSFPSIGKAEWLGPYSLDYSEFKLTETHPTDYTMSWSHCRGTFDESLKKISDKFIDECNKYREILVAYSVSWKFGPTEHPYNQKIREQLENLFPYKGEAFKKLLRINYGLKHQDFVFNFSFWRHYNSESHKKRASDIDVYLEKQGEQLKYYIYNPKESTGTLDIKIDEEIRPWVLRKNADKIQKKLEEKGVYPEILLGLPFKIWKEKTLKKMRNEERHYHLLTTLLKKMGMNDLRIELDAALEACRPPAES